MNPIIHQGKEEEELPPTPRLKKNITSPLSAQGQEQREITLKQIAAVKTEFQMIRENLQSLILQPPTQNSMPTLQYLVDTYGNSQLLQPNTYGMLLITRILLKIETLFLNGTIDDSTLLDIRGYIKKLLSGPDIMSIFAELGVLYFYVDKFDIPPCKDNFLQYRLREIEDEIAHLKNGDSGSLPTGISTYLLRAFSNMVIDSKGKINAGGAAAVNQLLDGRLSLHFKEDHKDHIKAVIKHLLEDSAFVEALEEPIVLHHNMEIFIRIDLKIPFGQKITEQHVKMATLIAAFFFDRRQFHPNCYVVASLIFGCRNQPCSVLKKYKEVLKTGFLLLTPTDKLHIFDLFSCRIVDDERMNGLITIKQAKSNASVYSALQAIGVGLDILDQAPQSSTLRELLHFACLQTVNPEGAYFLATSIIGSFTKNAMQEMLISVIEFQETNQIQTSQLQVESKLPFLRPNKKELMRFIIDTILLTFKRTYPDVLKTNNALQFFQSFEQKIKERLWLQDCTGKLRQDQQGQLSIRPSKEWIAIQNFEGNIGALERGISLLRRLISFNEQKITLIETVPDLHQFFMDLVNELRQKQEFPDVLTDNFILCFQGYLKAFLSNQCAVFLKEVNKRLIPLDLEHYKNSSLFVLSSDGGLVRNVCVALGLSYQRNEFVKGNGVANVLEIIQYFSSLNIDSRKEWLTGQKLALCLSNNHSFLIMPYAFYPLIENPEILKASSIHPFSKRMLLPISTEKKKKILDKLFSDTLESERIFRLSHDATTPQDFHDALKNLIDSVFYKKFLFLLEQEITKIDCTSIQWGHLLGEWFPKMEVTLKGKIEAQLIDTFSSVQELQAFEIASLLQQVFASFEISRPRLKLEMVICHKFDMPMSWVIGDLNFGKLVESPDHSLLILKMLPGGVQLLFRMGNEEFPLTENIYAPMHNLVLFD